MTFWSVYLLDRLVSCAPNRPPTISDNDCTVSLPLDSTFVSDDPPDIPTLQFLSDVPENVVTQKLDYFSQTISMASVLGRVQRCALQKTPSDNSFPPWDARSDYAAVYTQLLNFETYSDAMIRPFAEIIQRWNLSDGTIDRQAAGHFVYSIILYHMNQCLLHHPFLLHNRLNSCITRAPTSFVKEALGRGQQHARLLTTALKTVHEYGLTFSSFMGYACIVAATVHALYLHHDDSQIKEDSRQLLEASFKFLEGGQRFWDHYPRMVCSPL